MNIETLQNLIAAGKDSAMLRLSLATLLQDEGRLDEAVQNLQAALGFDPDYSAAWKALGKLQQLRGEPEAAVWAYQQGIAAAQRRGDKQAEKEMAVFLKRLQSGESARD